METSQKSHKNWIVAFQFFALLGFLVGLPSCQDSKIIESKGEPLVRIEPQDVDLGNIEEGKSKWANLILLNEGSKPITITSLKTSCGCTAAEIAETELAAGVRTTIKAEMANHGRRGQFGAVISVEWMESGTKKEGKAGAKISAKALYIADFRPSSLDFGNLSVEDDKLRLMLQIRRGDSSFKWNKIHLLNDFSGKVISEATISKKSDDEYEVTLELDPELAQLGTYLNNLRMSFEDSKANQSEERSIAVHASFHGPIEVIPKSIYFGMLDSREPKKGTIILRSKAQKKLSLVAISENSENKQIQFSSPVLSDYEISIPFEFTPKDESGNLSERISVTVSDGKDWNISIPVIGFLKTPRIN